MSTPHSIVGPQVSVDEDRLAEPLLEVNNADYVEQRQDAVVVSPLDPEEVLDLRSPALDAASEVDAADSLVEVSLDDDDWDN